MLYDEIIQSIEEHLKKSTKLFYSDFYIGITEDIRDCLFGYHQVEEKTDWWIYCFADTEEIARKIEKFYLQKGMDGGVGRDKDNGETKYVYCYEINEHTIERDEQ